MKKTLIYDFEIAKCIGSTPGYQSCDGWHDFSGMGIAVIGCWISWQNKYTYFHAEEIEEFQKLVNEADEIVGFNSLSFDDRLMKANDIKIETTYDLLCEVRVAAGMPPHYVRGVTRSGYSLNDLAIANFGFGKSSKGELAPKLWQDCEYKKVIDYCLNDVKLLKQLYDRRSRIIDPTDDEVLFCRGGNRLIHWFFKHFYDNHYLRVFLWAIVYDDIRHCSFRFSFFSFRFYKPEFRIGIPYQLERRYTRRKDPKPKPNTKLMSYDTATAYASQENQLINEDYYCEELDEIPF